MNVINNKTPITEPTEIIIILFLSKLLEPSDPFVTNSNLKLIS